MKEYQKPENNTSAFNSFMQYKEELEEEENLSLGDDQADWEAWWMVFLAGWIRRG
ncbi:hypothetical protein KKF82_04570 [Patescibacteria group bacterium]|nr:hypothetical protein [Patescibacteria group bacterium]